MIHNFLYAVLENASEMDIPFWIRSFKITTPLGGTYPHRYCMGVPPTPVEKDPLQDKVHVQPCLLKTLRRAQKSIMSNNSKYFSHILQMGINVQSSAYGHYEKENNDN